MGSCRHAPITRDEATAAFLAVAGFVRKLMPLGAGCAKGQGQGLPGEAPGGLVYSYPGYDRGDGQRLAGRCTADSIGDGNADRSV